MHKAASMGQGHSTYMLHAAGTFANPKARELGPAYGSFVRRSTVEAFLNGPYTTKSREANHSSYGHN